MLQLPAISVFESSTRSCTDTLSPVYHYLQDSAASHRQEYSGTGRGVPPRITASLSSATCGENAQYPSMHAQTPTFYTRDEAPSERGYGSVRHEPRPEHKSAQAIADDRARQHSPPRSSPVRTHSTYSADLGPSTGTTVYCSSLAHAVDIDVHDVGSCYQTARPTPPTLRIPHYTAGTLRSPTELQSPDTAVTPTVVSYSPVAPHGMTGIGAADTYLACGGQGTSGTCDVSEADLSIPLGIVYHPYADPAQVPETDVDSHMSRLSYAQTVAHHHAPDADVCASQGFPLSAAPLYIPATAASVHGTRRGETHHDRCPPVYYTSMEPGVQSALSLGDRTKAYGRSPGLSQLHFSRCGPNSTGTDRRF